MIKAEELKIGSYYKFQHIIGRLQSFKSNDIVELNVNDRLIVKSEYEDLQPIPLSEEWLLKMGFQKLPALDKWYIMNPPKYYYVNYFFIIKDGGKWWLTKSKSADGSNDLRINSVGFDSVHHLQNLVHSLTGEELTSKQEA